MPSKLVIMDGEHIWEYLLSGRTTVGRDTADRKVTVSFCQRFVSRDHGVIEWDRNGYCYMDTNNRNSTYYNGTMLYPGQRCRLRDGDVLQIRSGSFSGKGFAAMVYLENYPEQWETGEIRLTDTMAEINIGRGIGRGLPIRDAAVSLHHASFFAARSGWAVVDHNSRNGVFLNNQRLNSARYLRPGDCVRIVNNLFIFLGDRILYLKNGDCAGSGEAACPGGSGEVLSVRIAERSVWQRTKKLMLLQNIHMDIQSGEMVLILGGSGAGKTTFMNAVMGYEKAEGRVLYGSSDIYEDYESVKYRIGFVPQQDLLRGSDTVYDTLKNAAEMKLPSLRGGERDARIRKVMNDLGLSREAQSLVSKLSGGQRKRLSIAVEYIADPSLFFLDEPDSGLDGVMSRALMENLRKIADEGKIVMVISHGPDRARDLFDKVIVLAKSREDNCGHLAFFGPVQKALSFFDTDSLEGVVKRINRKDEGGDDLSDHYIRKYAQMIHRR